MREHISSEGNLGSRIGLPFTVQSHIDDNQPIGWKDYDSRTVYVDLKAVADEYSIMKNKKSFELAELFSMFLIDITSHMMETKTF